MGMKYEVDGRIFREITEKWPFAYISEFVIEARSYQTDQAGNKIELFQLNDGRIFSRRVPESVKSIIGRGANAQSTIPRQATSRG